MNALSFNFQDSQYIHSFENCIKSVRKFYKNELIDFYIDSNNEKINEYEKICKDYYVNFNIRDIHQGYIDRNDSIEINIPKMLESHYRIYMTCLKSNTHWILLLEDDVVIKRNIQRWPSSDCGKNRQNVGFLGGGSIFRRDVYIQAYESMGESGISNLIKTNSMYSWAGDELKRKMFDNINATSEKWIELAEPEYFNNTDHAVFHGYKELHKLG